MRSYKLVALSIAAATSIQPAYASLISVSDGPNGVSTIFKLTFGFLNSPVKYPVAVFLFLMGACICYKSFPGDQMAQKKRGHKESAAEFSVKGKGEHLLSAKFGFRPFALFLGVLLCMVGAIVAITEPVSGALI